MITVTLSRTKRCKGTLHCQQVCNRHAEYSAWNDKWPSGVSHLKLENSIGRERSTDEVFLMLAGSVFHSLMLSDIFLALLIHHVLSCLSEAQFCVCVCVVSCVMRSSTRWPRVSVTLIGSCATTFLSSYHSSVPRLPMSRTSSPALRNISLSLQPFRKVISFSQSFLL